MGQKIEVKVRFAETDLLGHVNNASYFVYLEEARVEFFKTVFPEKKQSFVVASVKCDFLRQAFFDQWLMIQTKVVKIGNKSFDLEHAIIDKNSGELIASGRSVVVHFNFEKQASETITSEMRKQLEQAQHI